MGSNDFKGAKMERRRAKESLWYKKQAEDLILNIFLTQENVRSELDKSSNKIIKKEPINFIH